MLVSLLVLVWLSLAGCQRVQEAAASAPAVLVAATEPAATSVKGKLVPRHSASLSLAEGARVKQLLVTEGEQVAAGDVLLQLDGYEQLQAQVASAEVEELAARQAIDELYKNVEVARAQAQIEIAQAEKEQALAEDHFNTLSRPLPPMTIDAGRSNLLLAERQLKQVQDDQAKAQRIFDNKKHIIWRFINKRQFKLRLTLLEQKVAGYERRYQDAVDKYEDLLAYPDKIDLALADARLGRANSRLAEAQRSLDELSNGPDPDAIEVAQARLHTAVAKLEAAQVGLRSAQLVAPINGVVVDLPASQGEWIAPGIPVVVLADLSEWQVESDKLAESLAPTVYPGQPVSLSVDAFPELALDGRVESLSQVYREEDGDIYYTIKIIPSKTDPRLMWGMSVDIEIPQSGAAKSGAAN